MSYTFKNITDQSTTVVKSEKGTLHAITINKAAANGVITVYDGAAALSNEIATITTPATLLNSQLTLIYDVNFTNNLTIVTATASQDITVSFS